MKIGIIGAGNVATGLAKLLVPKGHEIMLSFSRDTDKLAQMARAFATSAGSVAEAVAFGEVLAIATPYAATQAALKQVGASIPRKILWDCTNALTPDMSGLAIGTTTSAAEEIQRTAPWARVVKGIPPFAEVMHSGNVRIHNKGIGVFVASDDDEAKRTVTTLITDLGAEPTDAGPLSNARYIEPAGYLLVQLAYLLGYGANIGLSLLK